MNALREVCAARKVCVHPKKQPQCHHSHSRNDGDASKNVEEELKRHNSEEHTDKIVGMLDCAQHVHRCRPQLTSEDRVCCNFPNPGTSPSVAK